MVMSFGSAFNTELNKETGAQPVILLDLDFTTGNRRFAMWPANVVYASNTYEGLGPVGEAEVPEQTQDGSLTEQFMQFFVQNQPDFLADIQQNCRGLFCYAWIVFLNSSGTPAGNEAYPYFYKRQIPGKSTGDKNLYMTEMALESRFHRHRLRAPRTYSHPEQLRRDSSDFCMFNAGKILDLTRKRYRQRSGLPS